MWDKPIVEFRIDTIVMGSLPKFLELTELLAMPSLLKHVGKPLAYYVTVAGSLNRVFQLWEFDSYGELEDRRGALGRDPAWEKCVNALEGVILQRKSSIMRRVNFLGVDELGPQVHDKRIVDLRTYTIKHNGMRDFLSATEKYCLPVQLRHIGPPLAYYVTEIGDVDRVTHLWGYDSLADMEVRRAARYRDPDWQIYSRASEGLFVNQETQLVRRLPLPI